MRIYRLEFLQPDGRWTGPYCAEHMTSSAFALRDAMTVDHLRTRRFPDENTFLKNPGPDRYVCGCKSLSDLEAWFGPYFGPFLSEGGHIGTYDVPEESVAEDDGTQIVYQQRRGVLLERTGQAIDNQRLIERIHPSKKRATVRASNFASALAEARSVDP